MNTTKTTHCSRCGKLLTVQQIKEQNKYCSLSCAYCDRYTGSIKTCPVCGKNFYAPKWKSGVGRGKYCSSRCRQIDDKLWKTCPTCGKTFNARHSHKTYCCKKCWGASEAHKDILKHRRKLTPEEISNAKIKEFVTKKKRGTLTTSKPEEYIKIKLASLYPNLKTQHQDPIRYPFRCDFYIPEIDLFIEYQGNWTHGGGPYNPRSKRCQDQLASWINKNTPYYKKAVAEWTKRDTLKRKVAKQNNLNWIEFFSLIEFDLWLERHINHQQSHRCF